MKKKIIIISIIVAIAVFASSLTTTLLILNHHRDGGNNSAYSLRSDDSQVGKTVKSELNDCKTPEDYYNLACRYVDEHKIFYANEIIKTGYQKTKDKSLDIAVITGKPTLLSTVIAYTQHRVYSDYGIADSVQYFLGRDTVISAPCMIGPNTGIMPRALIYHFDSTTRQIIMVEYADEITVSQLDNDLTNIALTTKYSAGNYGAEAVFDFEYGKGHYSFQVSYHPSGEIASVDYYRGMNPESIILNRTPSGYQFKFDENTVNVDMIDNNIQKISDGEFSETFIYNSDDSYRLSSTLQSEQTVRYYDSKNLLIKVEVPEAKQVIEISYNQNHLLTEASSSWGEVDRGHPLFTQKEGEGSEYFGYKDDLFLTSFTVAGNETKMISFSYDDQNRLVKVDDGIETLTYSYNDNGTVSNMEYVEYGEVNKYQLYYDKSGILSYVETDNYIRWFTRNEGGYIIGYRDEDVKTAPSL